MSKETFNQFRNLPWLTDGLFSTNQPLQPSLKNLLIIIKRCEQNIFSGEETCTDVLEILESKSPVSQLIREANFSSASFVLATNYLMYYRILDVAQFLSLDSMIRPQLHTRCTPPKFSLTGWDAFLANWTNIVQDASSLFSQVTLEPTPEPSPEDGAHMGLPEFHLSSILRRQDRVEFHRILINFELAAMYLSSLFQGDEYPDTLVKLAATLNLNLFRLQSILPSNGNVAHLQLPLHTALSISPIVLLIPTTIHKSRIKHHELLGIWQGLRADRPSALVSIERRLWSLLFDIAASPRTCTISRLKVELRAIASTLDQQIDADAITWFCPPEARGSHLLESGRLTDLEDEEGMHASPTGNDPMDVDAGEAHPISPRPKRNRTDGGQTAPPQSSNSKRPPVSLVLKGKERNPPQPGQSVKVAGRWFEVVDLTANEEEMHEISLHCSKVKGSKTAGKEQTLLDIQGNKVPYTPLVHFRDQERFITSLISRVEKDYDSETGLPLYLADPSRSAIKIMSKEEFASRSTAEIQALHARHHLLVTGGPAAAFGFDEVGMETLASPSHVFTIHDFSVKVQSGNQNVRHRTGTTAHLLDSHNSPKTVGKILNSLDFPCPHFDDPSPPLATDLFSFRRNASRQDLAEDYPDADMRWGLAATSDAYSSFHIDSHGLATYISCVNEDVLAFANIKNMFDFHAEDALEPDKFPDLQFEAVLMRPGMTLYMRPSTPHAVVTPTAAICHGGYYLTTSCLRQTCHGYLTTFTLSTILTNAELTSKVQLLFRQLAFFFLDAFMHGAARLPPTTRAHLPDLATFEGLLDLFSFCNILELSNVTHPGSYSLPGLGVSERLEMIRGRAVARAIVEWVITHYEFANKEIGRFYYDHLAYQTRTLVNSTRFAEKNGTFSFNGIPIATSLEKLVGKTFEPTHPFWDSWKEYSDEQLDFTWPLSAERPAVRLRDHPLAVENMVRQGMTPDDLEWEKNSEASL